MKDEILNTIDDLVVTFLHEDRKEDEELPKGAIELHLVYGQITANEIANRFKDTLLDTLRAKGIDCR